MQNWLNYFIKVDLVCTKGAVIVHLSRMDSLDSPRYKFLTKDIGNMPWNDINYSKENFMSKRFFKFVGFMVENRLLSW